MIGHELASLQKLGCSAYDAMCSMLIQSTLPTFKLHSVTLRLAKWVIATVLVATLRAGMLIAAILQATTAQTARRTMTPTLITATLPTATNLLTSSL